MQGLEPENCNSTIGKKQQSKTPVSSVRLGSPDPTYPVSHIFGTLGVRPTHPTSGVRGMLHWQERHIGVECCEENWIFLDVCVFQTKGFSWCL